MAARRDLEARVEQRCGVPDRCFTDPRLAEAYDYLDPDRADLDVYLALVDGLGASSVLDIGCGTGSFACLLARHGRQVIGVDPAEASLDVARRKTYATRVQWVLAEATALPPTQVDLITMTGNVAQVFLTDDDWVAALRATRGALKPGGHLVFEVRDPAREGWRDWTRAQSHHRAEVPGAGAVQAWVDLTNVAPPVVSFRWTYLFEATGVVLASDSTLRFRDRPEIEASLAAAGFATEEVRDAPDRPGKEFVFIARTSDV